MKTITRRQALIGAVQGALYSTSTLSAASSPVIETHVHLFDPERVPYAPAAPYKPPAYTLESHVKLVQEAGLAHSIIVHPEPYQDDHRYLEYCFAHEPSPGYFKGTCLFDPIAPRTPERIEALVAKNPKRIVALRIHEMRARGLPPTTAGSIKERDLRSPAMHNTWRKVQQLGLAIQLHFLPFFARSEERRVGKECRSR